MDNFFWIILYSFTQNNYFLDLFLLDFLLIVFFRIVLRRLLFLCLFVFFPPVFDGIPRVFFTIIAASLKLLLIVSNFGRYFLLTCPVDTNYIHFCDKERTGLYKHKKNVK